MIPQDYTVNHHINNLKNHNREYAMSEQTQLPDGYRKDHRGYLVPEEAIKPIDRARDELVMEIINQALPLSEMLTRFKQKSLGDVGAFVELSAEQYGAKLGGKKGNVTLVSFDGNYRVSRSCQDRIAFNERLQAAKELIDNCMDRWVEGANPQIREVVKRAFRKNSKGELKTAYVLDLRNWELDDEEWQRAMDALTDAIFVTGSTTYITAHRRIGDGDKWELIPLSLAAV